MSEIVENVCEQNSAQSKNAAAVQSAETVQAVTTNNVESVPVSVKTASATENVDELLSKPAAEQSSTSPKEDNKKTAVKRTPSKRMSFIERAQKESEELVKNMGGSLEMEGGRKTRSSTRGTPTRSAVVSTPPPTKKARASPASGASTPTRPRGRGRKIETAADVAEEEEEILPTPSKKNTPAKGNKAAAAAAVDTSEEANEMPEKSEDNEKSKDEDKLDSAEPKANISNVCEEPKATPEKKVAEKQATDKIDAVLESAAATEINVTKEPEIISDAQVKDKVTEVTESVKSDSPMETDEIESVPEKKEEVTTAVPAAAVVAKEPTPEPMEVDSKSNDALEKIDAEVNKVHQNVQAAVPTVETSTLQLNNVEKVKEIAQQNSVKPTIVAPSTNFFVANNLIDVKSVAAESVAAASAVANKTNIEESTILAANDSNKNDLCEPKIATSPPVIATNDNGSVTTPQFCN